MFRHRGGPPAAGPALIPPPSSSSTLSPLAPPFTVDRRPIPLNSVPSFRYSPPPPPPPPPSSSPFSLRVPSRDADLRPFPSIPSVGEWPGFVPSDRVEEATVTHLFRDGLDDVAGSSWMNPYSGSGLSSFLRGSVPEGSEAYGNTSYGWHGKHGKPLTGTLHYGPEWLEWLQYKDSVRRSENAAVPYYLSETTVRAPDSFLKQIPHSQPSEPISVMEPCNTSSDNIMENATGPYNNYKVSDWAPGTSLGIMPCSRISDPTSVVDSCSAFDLNSSYAGYMAQLSSSSSKDPIMYYPGPTCSTSTQAYTPSANIIGTSMEYSVPNDMFNTFRHVDPYKISEEYVDYDLTGQKESSSSRNAEAQEGCNGYERAIVMEKDTGISMNFFPLGRESAMGKQEDRSADLKSELRINHLKISDAFNSECNLAKPDGSVQNFQETSDQTVDSPCWRGASATRQSAFNVDETVNPSSTVMETKGCNGSGRDRKYLPTSTAYSEIFHLEQYRMLSQDGDKKGSLMPDATASSSVSISPSIQQKFGEPHKKLSDCMKDDNVKGTWCSDISKEQKSNLRKDKSREAEANINSRAQLLQEVVSVNQPVLADDIGNSGIDKKHGISDNLSHYSPQAIGEAISDDIVGPCHSAVFSSKSSILHSLQYMSGMLLSSDCNDARELNDNDRELLQLIIDNLEAFAVKNKKGIVKKRSHDSSVEATQSWTGKSNGDSIVNAFRSMGKIIPCLPCTNSDNLGNMVFNYNASNLNKDNVLALDLEKNLEKNFCEQEESLQALAYKKLWLEAEAAVCSMKYELQLACMKTDRESYRHQSNGDCQPLHKPSNLNSADDDNQHGKPLEAMKINSPKVPLPHMLPAHMACRWGSTNSFGRPKSPTSSTLKGGVWLKLEETTGSMRMEGYSHPISAGGAGIGTSAAENPNGKTGQVSDITGIPASGDVAMRGLVIPSYMPIAQGKQSLFGGQDNSPSSEWEDVWREELI